MPHFGSSKFNRVLNFDITPVQSKSKVNHCCQHMDISVNYTCDHGHEKWECADSTSGRDDPCFYPIVAWVCNYSWSQLSYNKVDWSSI